MYCSVAERGRAAAPVLSSSVWPLSSCVLQLTRDSRRGPALQHSET